MSRLVVVSNRVTLPDEDGSQPPGGMAIALNAALRQRGGLWMGWSGKVKANEDDPPTLITREADGITYKLADLSLKDLDEYYYGFANRVLWPVFHCRVDLAEYSEARMSGYERVNELFAKLLKPLLRDDDMIWVHDYHLIPLAEELRNLGCGNKIGFFLHTPWPPADILFTVPHYEDLMRGLSRYNLVGFHTDDDLDNFAACLRRQGHRDPIENGVCLAYQRVFRCGVFPISIDTAEFERLAERAAREKALQEPFQRIARYKVAIGVDRLDYSKGIEKRIVAFDRFLRSNGNNIGETQLLQITPKCREEIPAYQAVEKDVAELVGRVVGALGTIDWMPVHYINRSIGRSELAGLYRMARIGLVTPLRDGMNLVAKEYVAAQDPRNPGVLVLSRFAGAARELGGAILVNPYDLEAMAKAIQEALDMRLDQRIDRWRAMIGRLREYDVSRWCGDFLLCLGQS